jgi:hypothetical protein
MKIDLPAGNNALEELYGEGYFGRVYRTSLAVFVLVALMVAGRGGLPAVIGYSYGAAVSLGSLKLIELMVRWFLRPELPWNRARVSLLMVLKLPFLTVILAGAAWMSVHGVANVFALVGGLGLAPAVIFLKTAGAGLLNVLPSLPVPTARTAKSGARPPRPGTARPALPQPVPGTRVAGGGFVMADPHFNGGLPAAD